MLWRFTIISSAIIALTLATPPRGSSRQNFYNYRTDFDDDQNYAQFEGDTNGNFHSEFGQRIGASRSSPDLDSQDESLDYSDNLIPAEDEDNDGGRRLLKTTWSDPPVRNDASYGFGYDIPNQSRHETSDSFGNVNGWYSYIDDEGVYRQISYSAGAGTGFVVRSKHTSRVRPPTTFNRGGGGWGPASPTKVYPTRGWEEEQQLYPIGPTRPTLSELQNQRERPWSPPRRRKPSYVVKIRRPVKQDPAWVYFRPPNPGRLAPSRGSGSSGGWTAPPPPPRPQRPTKVYPEDSFGSGGWSEPDTTQDNSYPKDASYAFGFDAGDHNRHEVSDPWGNVRGSYSYIDPEGIRRTVHYSASSATGFKILKAEPSNVVSTVYREPSQSRPRPRPQPQQPSAFVYHLHPDGGWKPWEASHSRVGQGGNKPRRPFNSVSQSYHYQSQTIQGRKGEESRAKSLLTPTGTTATAAKGQRGQTTKPQPPVYQDDPLNDQQYSDGADYDGGYDSLRTEAGDAELQQVSESKRPEIRGYRGGYGDKNPLLVVSESASRPRTADPENNEEFENNSKDNKVERETQTTGPISIGKMMSMRMSSSQKKSSRSRSSRTKEANKGQSSPVMMSNPGRLMHYPKSRNSQDGE